MEKKGNNPPAEYIGRICELLNISVEYLILGQEKSVKLSDSESELLYNFRLLPEKEQYRLLGKLEAMVDIHKEPDSPKSSISGTG